MWKSTLPLEQEKEAIEVAALSLDYNDVSNAITNYRQWLCRGEAEMISPC